MAVAETVTGIGVATIVTIVAGLRTVWERFATKAAAIAAPLHSTRTDAVDADHGGAAATTGAIADIGVATEVAIITGRRVVGIDDAAFGRVIATAGDTTDSAIVEAGYHRATTRAVAAEVVVCAEVGVVASSRIVGTGAHASCSARCIDAGVTNSAVGVLCAANADSCRTDARGAADKGTECSILDARRCASGRVAGIGGARIAVVAMVIDGTLDTGAIRAHPREAPILAGH